MVLCHDDFRRKEIRARRKWKPKAGLLYFLCIRKAASFLTLKDYAALRIVCFCAHCWYLGRPVTRRNCWFRQAGRKFYLHSRSKTCFVGNDYMETLYYFYFCSVSYLLCVHFCTSITWQKQCCPCTWNSWTLGLFIWLVSFHLFSGLLYCTILGLELFHMFINHLMIR